MSVFMRILLLAALLTGALVCYQAGFQTGVFVLVILGMALEFGFWLGIYKWERAKAGPSNPQ